MAAIFGTFACQASNIAGKILVSRLDYTPNYLVGCFIQKRKDILLGGKNNGIIF